MFVLVLYNSYQKILIDLAPVRITGKENKYNFLKY